MQAAIDSHVLPAEPSTILHLSSRTRLLAPASPLFQDGEARGNTTLGNVAHRELDPPSSFLLAAAASGLANRIFQVEPAPENREELEYEAGEVHYQHRPRQDAVRTDCILGLNQSNLLVLAAGDAASCCEGCGLLPSTVQVDKGGPGLPGIRFVSWRGQLADASKVEEVDFDADELINAIVPMGSYILSIDMSFFSRTGENKIAPECQWLTE